MRRILVESARRKARLKHGGGRERREVDEADAITISDPIDLIALDDALEKLAREDKVKAELVKLRYFAGLTAEQAGQYVLVDSIGQGGMATVYRATQPSIGRTVAVKVLPSHFLQDATFLERFRREVQVIAQLQHPHILPVYDFGEQDGIPYIVMAYMDGGTLADRIAHGAIPLREAVRMVEQIAQGLDHAHRNGVIHRDFKPSNVLLDQYGNVHLADFGVA